MRPSDKPLSVSDVKALGVLVSMVQRSAHFARQELGEVYHGDRPGEQAVASAGRLTGGTVRSFCHAEQGSSLGAVDDVRDVFVWVTLDTGFETWWPVAVLVEETKDGLFVEYEGGVE